MSGAHNHDWDARKEVERAFGVNRPSAPDVDDHKGRSMVSQETGRIIDVSRAPDGKPATDQQTAELRLSGSDIDE